MPITGTAPAIHVPSAAGSGTFHGAMLYAATYINIGALNYPDFATTQFDTDGFVTIASGSGNYPAGSHIFTVPSALGGGNYLVGWGIYLLWYPGSGTYAALTGLEYDQTSGSSWWITYGGAGITGNAIRNINVSNAWTVDGVGMALIPLVTGDTVGPYALQESGSTIQIFAGSFITIQKVG